MTKDKVLTVAYFKYFLGLKPREESSDGGLNGGLCVLMKSRWRLRSSQHCLTKQIRGDKKKFLASFQPMYSFKKIKQI